MRGIKHTVERAKACRASLKAVGATLGDVYWTNGQYDVILSFDAPDGETAFKARLANAMLGNAHWTILRVFGEREMEKLIGELPLTAATARSSRPRHQRCSSPREGILLVPRAGEMLYWLRR